MKKLFLGSVALVALGLGTPAALAADRGVPAYTPPPPPVPVYTWTGCYVGASAGSNSGTTDGVSSTGASVLTPGAPALVGVSPLTGSLNLTGFIGGFQGGCNWQWGAWVLGIEGDGSATNKEGQAFTNIAATPTGLAVNPLLTYHVQERWLTTARARLGWTIWDKTMVYVTGGAAWAKIDTTQQSLGSAGGLVAFLNNPVAIQSDTRSGWTVGGGLEYLLGYGWSAKGEFLYVDFGDFTTITACGGPTTCNATGGIVSNVQVNKLHDYVWRAGLNYKFW